MTRDATENKFFEKKNFTRGTIYTRTFSIFPFKELSLQLFFKNSLCQYKSIGLWIIKIGPQEAEIWTFEYDNFTCKTTTTNDFQIVKYVYVCVLVSVFVVRSVERCGAKWWKSSTDFPEILKGARDKST